MIANCSANVALILQNNGSKINHQHRALEIGSQKVRASVLAEETDKLL